VLLFFNPSFTHPPTHPRIHPPIHAFIQPSKPNAPNQFVVTKAPVLVGSTKSLLRRLAQLSRAPAAAGNSGRGGALTAAAQGDGKGEITPDDRALISEVRLALLTFVEFEGLGVGLQSVGASLSYDEAALPRSLPRNHSPNTRHPHRRTNHPRWAPA